MGLDLHMGTQCPRDAGLLPACRRYLAAALVVALLVPFAPGLLAQTGVPDSKGTSFWIPWMPNVHGVRPAGKLLIYVTSEAAAAGTITSYAPGRPPAVIDFDIAAGEMARFELPYATYELLPGEAQRPVLRGTNIESDEEVTVYAASRETNTTDAWLVLPVDALGNDYRILSWPSGTQDGSLRPSQFTVVATEDRTEVTIDVEPGRTSRGGQRVIRTTLDRGQAYLVQAYQTLFSATDDLTGSRVRSSRPVVVVSGHQRAATDNTNTASRDLLAEQLPSVDRWDTLTIIPTMQAASDNPQQASGRYRIVAHGNGTVVDIGGQRFTLNAGQSLAGSNTTPVAVRSSQPVLVALIDRTSGERQNTRLGDPSLLVIPPVGQFMSAYTLVSVEPDAADAVYSEHWLTMVVPDTLPNTSVTIDGITPAIRQPVAGAPYAIVHHAVSAGVHRVEAAAPVGIIAYGYAPAESYGYTGGMAFTRLRTPVAYVRVLDVEGAPGDERSIRLVLDSVTNAEDFASLAPQSFRADLLWNATQFVATQPLAISGNGPMVHTLTGTLAVPAGTPDTLASLSGTMVLGNVAWDSIQAIDVAWLDAGGNPVDVRTVVDNGIMTTTSLCLDNGTRLFDGRTPPPVVKVAQTMSGATITATRLDLSTSVSVDITSVLGQRYELFHGIPPETTLQVAIPTAVVAPGYYIVRLVTSNVVRTTSVIVP